LASGFVRRGCLRVFPGAGRQRHDYAGIGAAAGRAFNSSSATNALRLSKTLQDRLVKELRLQGIGTIAAGNQLLPGFLADYNARARRSPFHHQINELLSSSSPPPQGTVTFLSVRIYDFSILRDTVG
jgi:hypothetical protein